MKQELQAALTGLTNLGQMYARLYMGIKKELEDGGMTDKAELHRLSMELMEKCTQTLSNAAKTSQEIDPAIRALLSKGGTA